MQQVTVEQLADAFEAHPQTIIAHHYGKGTRIASVLHNPIPIRDVAKTFGIDTRTLRRVLYGRDQIITTRQAAKIVGRNVGKFHAMHRRYRELRPVIRDGAFRRYLKSEIAQFAATISSEPKSA